MSVIRGYIEEIRSSPHSPPGLDRALTHIDTLYDQLLIMLPGLQQGKVNTPLSASNPSGLVLPTPCPFQVVGVDGKYLVTITLPQNAQPASVLLLQSMIAANQNSALAPIVHRLQSATDTNFSATSNVTTYGPSAQLSWEIQDPNQTKFWRLSSSYDGANFNTPVLFSSPLVCGPVGVNSGLLRNSANSLNQSATTPSGSNPLTQHSTTTQIDVASSVWKCGDQTISYNSGNVNPGSFGTWFVYANDPKRAGGTVTFIAVNSANQANITSDNGNVYFGTITTSGGGGGTGSGGGGGTCCRQGVPYRMLDGSLRDCSLLQVGDVLMGVDGGPEVIQSIELHPARPCFHLEFDASGKLSTKNYIGDFTVYAVELDRSHTFLAGDVGVIDGAASSHTVQYAGGGFSDVFGIVVGEPFNLINGSVGSHNYRKV